MSDHLASRRNWEHPAARCIFTRKEVEKESQVIVGMMVPPDPEGELIDQVSRTVSAIGQESIRLHRDERDDCSAPIQFRVELGGNDKSKEPLSIYFGFQDTELYVQSPSWREPQSIPVAYDWLVSDEDKPREEGSMWKIRADSCAFHRVRMSRQPGSLDCRVKLCSMHDRRG